MTDPIRARLDLLECSRSPKGHMAFGALRAVLDLCDSRHSDTGYGVVRLDTLRRVIAEHLGVTDETPRRPRVGAMLFCAACRVAYDSRKQDHSGH